MIRPHVLVVLAAALALVVLAAPGGAGIKGAEAAVRLGAANPRPAVPPGTRRLQAGALLVAARDLADPNFRHTVVLLLAYGPTGTLGVVLNRPATFAMADVLGEHAVPGDAGWAARVKVHLGGPVEPRRVLLLVRTDAAPPDAQELIPSVYASASLRTLEWAAAHLEAEAVHVYAGYAGWAPDQLEREVDAGGWHVLPATAELVFAPPAELWPKLIRDASGTWVRREESIPLPNLPLPGPERRGHGGQIATQDVFRTPCVR